MPIPNIPYNPITINSLPREGVPLHNHPDGQVRIIGTRISLEIFLEAHKLGAWTPEQLAHRSEVEHRKGGENPGGNHVPTRVRQVEKRDA